MVPSFSFSGPHFERRRAERDPPGTYLEGKTKTAYKGGFFFQKVRFVFQISKSQKKKYIPKNYPELEI